MKIVIIGTGNVATQLGIAFKTAGHTIVQVFGRDIDQARLLSKKLNSGFTIDLGEINLNANFYLIAVSDSSIENVIQKIKLKNQIIVHTSGSVPMNVFKNKFLNYGIFYPLQTILKQKKTDFNITPVCIESNNKNTLAKLTALAKSITNTIYQVTSEQRAVIHLSAVFVNNFTNHLFSIAEIILVDNKISFEILKPLIEQTVSNIKDKSPMAVQTGPAMRGDEKIISMHLNMLKKYPEYKKIYKELTQSIQNENK
jgi:predicted short-subunit dehydrogenase-like oxidoreductase (DUF2520 family)